jgi:hypothetical protein
MNATVCRIMAAASVGSGWLTLVLYRRRALHEAWGGRDGALGRAFDKAVRRKPLAGAADAGCYGNSIDFLPEKPCQTRTLVKRLLLMLIDVGLLATF